MSSPTQGPFARIMRGASGVDYDTGGGGIDRLQRRYDELITHYGGLAPTLVAIASMLDIPAVNTDEGLRPDVVCLLLQASQRLKSPLSATAVLALTDENAPQRDDAERLARRYL